MSSGGSEEGQIVRAYGIGEARRRIDNGINDVDWGILESGGVKDRDNGILVDDLNSSVYVGESKNLGFISLEIDKLRTIEEGMDKGMVR